MFSSSVMLFIVANLFKQCIYVNNKSYETLRDKTSVVLTCVGKRECRQDKAVLWINVRAKRSCSNNFALLLLIVAGDVEFNPGPYPCGVCFKNVRQNQESVCCDTCQQWFHRKCMNMPPPVFAGLIDNSVSWHCCNCGLPNLSSSLFESARDPTSPVSSGTTVDDSMLSEDIGYPVLASSPVKQPSPKRQSKTRSKTITVLSVNCNSLKSSKKQADLMTLIDNHNPNIILGCESKLSPDIPTYECFPPDFEVFRKDRDTHGGGVFIAIDKRLTAKHETNLDRNCEAVWASVQMVNTQKLYLCSFYRPPNSTTKDIDELESAFMDLHQSSRGKHPNIVIGGDFNCPNVKWSSNNETGNICSPVEKHFEEFCNSYDLTQHVKEATRVESGNVLDLILTSKPNLVMNTEVTVGMSDHSAVVSVVDLRPKYYHKPPRNILQFSRADFDAMRMDALEFSTEFMLNQPYNRTIDENWNILKNKINFWINKYIPVKRAKTSRHLPWINRNIKKQMRKRDKLYKKAKTSRNWSVFNRQRNYVQELIKKAHNEYVRGLGDSLKTGESKKFYSYIKLKRTENMGVPVLFSNNKYHITDTDKANALNKQFHSVFVQESSSEAPDMGPSPYPSIGALTFTRNGVAKLLQGLKPNKACGPDDLPARVLKELSHSIADVVTFIYQQSYNNGQVPSDWLHARVTGLYKKGDKTCPANYRPVSLTCILCKCMEHIMFSHISSHLEKHKILTPRQHGFRTGFSCTTQLISAVHDWAETIDNKGQTDIALLDFSKAFDRVSHARLSIKLDYYGISGKSLQWVNAFLGNRTQSVVVNGQSSERCSVSSGVPQGTVMGPLLFLIFINDIVKDLHSQLRLFADDSTLYRNIETEEDHTKFQEDLLRLQNWAETWSMDFNVLKCAIMSVSLKRNPSLYEYKMKNQTVPRVDYHDYLGVTIHNKLSWDLHIKRITSKALKTLGMLRRNLHSCSTETKALSYLTLVRPQLEYASCAWAPYTKKHKEILEKVQNAAARYVTGQYSRYTSVSDLIQQLKWNTLEHRRRVEDLTMFHKIEKNLVRIKFPPPVVPSRITHTRKNHERQKAVIGASLNVYKYSYFVRTIPTWNDLTADCVEAKDSIAFKSALEKL